MKKTTTWEINAEHFDETIINLRDLSDGNYFSLEIVSYDGDYRGEEEVSFKLIDTDFISESNESINVPFKSSKLIRIKAGDSSYLFPIPLESVNQLKITKKSEALWTLWNNKRILATFLKKENNKIVLSDEVIKLIVLNNDQFILTENLEQLKSLTYLNLSGCNSLIKLDGLSNLTSLTSIDLSDCKNLKNVDALNNLKSLISLELYLCESLTNVDGLKNLPSLNYLNLAACISLRSVDGLQNLPSLTSLNLAYCTSLENLNGLQNLPSLTTLILHGCHSLENADCLQELPELAFLDVHGCDEIKNDKKLNKLSSSAFIHR